MPEDIATYLYLPNTEQYCFRRTSATLMADSGENISKLKRHGAVDGDPIEWRKINSDPKQI